MQSFNHNEMETLPEWVPEWKQLWKYEGQRD